MPSFMASFIPVGATLGQTATLIIVFLLTTFPGAFAWAAFGELLKSLMADPKKRKVFNWIAGLALVASMVPVVFF